MDIRSGDLEFEIHVLVVILAFMQYTELSDGKL